MHLLLTQQLALEALRRSYGSCTDFRHLDRCGQTLISRQDGGDCGGGREGACDIQKLWQEWPGGRWSRAW